MADPIACFLSGVILLFCSGMAAVAASTLLTASQALREHPAFVGLGWAEGFVARSGPRVSRVMTAASGCLAALGVANILLSVCLP